MTDRELLELAAKAAGISGQYASLDEFPDWMTAHDGEGIYYASSRAWNPLTDDGDALRLAVNLNFMVSVHEKQEVRVIWWPVGNSRQEVCEVFANDPHAATRRAIVRAAAEIGKQMK